MNAGPATIPAAALIVLCGRSFSGKSTVARELSGPLDAEIISLDAINAERGLAGGQGIPVEEWVATNAEAVQRAGVALEHGRTVVIDDTTSPRFLRDGWRALAEQRKVGFVLVYVDTAPHVTRERLLANRARSQRPDVSDEVMSGHVAGFDAPGPDEPHVTTGSTVDEMPVLLAAIRTALSPEVDPTQS